MKLTGVYITCPFCFETFSAADVHFRCMNDGCGGRALDTVYANHRNMIPILDDHVIKPSVVSGVDALRSRYRLPTRVPCDVCGVETSKRLCPNCHFRLSSDAGRVRERSIAIIGGRNTGKSHYIATLVHRFEHDVSQHFNASLHRVGDRSRDRWEKDFYGPLYRNKRVIQATQSAAVNVQVKEPLVCRLTFDGGRRARKLVNLTFFDTAGEDMHSLDTMTTETRYILKAEAIIFLLDPLQIDAVRQRLPGANLPEMDVQSNPQYIVERLRELFEYQGGLKPREKVQTPIAFTLSKIDTLLPIIEAGSGLRLSGEHFGYLNLPDVQSVHTEIENYIQVWMGGSFSATVRTGFADYRYFGVSSLGQMPDGANRLASVSPMRVEDPFLWALYRFGIIKGRK